MRSNDSR